MKKIQTIIIITTLFAMAIIALLAPKELNLNNFQYEIKAGVLVVRLLTAFFIGGGLFLLTGLKK